MDIAEDKKTDRAAVDEDYRQFLTFSLADEEYGVDILRVQEVKGWAPVTRIPRAPDYVQGVLNLRGTIVPILDLRKRFHLDEIVYTRTTVIVVINIDTDAGKRVIGVVVDGVSDVINVDLENIKAAPDFGTKVHTDFITGLATVDDNMVMLLDIDKLLSAREIKGLDALA